MLSLIALLLCVLSLSLVSAIAPGGEQATYEAYRLLPRSNLSSASTSSPPAPSSFVSSASSLSSAAAKVGTLRFVLVTAEAPWSPRSIGSAELFTKSLTYTPVGSTRKVTIASNAFVLHGGSGAGNDVWVSGDHGKSWSLAAGVTIDDEPASSPADETSFINYGAAAVLIDRSSNIFRIGGRDGQQETDAVWFSANALTWKDQADGSSAPFDSQRFYAAATATSTGEIILQGGTVDNFRSYRADVWSSTTQGRSWRLQTSEAAFGARGIGVLLSSQQPSLFSGKDILYLLGGQNEKDNSNEVWVSSDSGRLWLPLQLRAPWPQRDAFNGEITGQGVLIISSGLADRDTGLSQETPINDVWASLDGGYTWGECVQDAQFEDRYLQFTMLDEQGYFYVIAGRALDGGLHSFNDVWKSSISFHDIDAVSRACNLAIPPCGVGLKCFPDSDTVVAADGSYVSCAACPHPKAVAAAAAGASSSSSSVILAGFLVVFAVLFVLAGGCLVYVLYRLRTAGGQSPLPLPSSVQRWWNKSNSSALIGQHGLHTDDGQTHDAGAPPAAGLSYGLLGNH